MTPTLTTASLNEALTSSKLSLNHITTIHVLESTASTNSDLLEAEKNGAESGTFYIARKQHSGRGRLSRSWLMNEGDIACSLLLRRRHLPHPPTLLALMPAVAIIDALDILGIPAMIKWPNDIVKKNPRGCSLSYFADYLKIGGILVENVVAKDGLSASVIGIGINVIDVPEHKDLVPHRGHLSLWSASISASQVLAYLLSALDQHVQNFLDPAYPAFLHERYQQRCASLGQTLFIEHHGQKIIGVGEGITKAGALSIRVNDSIQLIYGGEVNFCT